VCVRSSLPIELILIDLKPKPLMKKTLRGLLDTGGALLATLEGLSAALPDVLRAQGLIHRNRPLIWKRPVLKPNSLNE
jgi:hypothetical protein